MTVHSQSSHLITCASATLRTHPNPRLTPSTPFSPLSSTSCTSKAPKNPNHIPPYRAIYPGQRSHDMYMHPAHTANQQIQPLSISVQLKPPPPHLTSLRSYFHHPTISMLSAASARDFPSIPPIATVPELLKSRGEKSGHRGPNGDSHHWSELALGCDNVGGTLSTSTGLVRPSSFFSSDFLAVGFLIHDAAYSGAST